MCIIGFKKLLINSLSETISAAGGRAHGSRPLSLCRVGLAGERSLQAVIVVGLVSGCGGVSVGVSAREGPSGWSTYT